ncbi:MAG TPA: prolyl oligopeptidase family serine peptidase [Chthoniobacteraceae bacterium]|nr:prolyl oligopeptidase family serine peptidase [Chthoniobacteraceae bacterium]
MNKTHRSAMKPHKTHTGLKSLLPLLVLLPCLAFAADTTKSITSSEGQGWIYPKTKTGADADTYFGKTYPDPYRWLEDLKSPEVKTWFTAQGKITDDLLARIPGRDALVKEWLALDKLKPAAYASFDFEGGRMFYKKTLGGENVGKLYYREGWDGAEKLLFDPGVYQKGVVTTIQSFSPSWDGKHVVLGLSSGGAEWSELRVLNVDDGTLLPEKIYPSYGPSGWAQDNKTFFYDAGKETDIKSNDIELNRKTRLHTIGAPVANDPDILSNESYPGLDITPREMPSAFIDESYPDRIWGFVNTVQNEMRAYYAPASDLDKKTIAWKEVCKPSDNLIRGITFAGDYIYAITHTGAPKYKLVRTSVKDPDWARAETVIPEAGDTIQSLDKTRHYLILVYSNGVQGRLVQYELATGKTSGVKLPMDGTVSVESPDWKSDRCLVNISSWTSPRTTFDYDPATGAFARSAFDTAISYPQFQDLVSEEVQAPAPDGAMVPLSIIHKKGITLDGSHCCILEGYGAYGYSIHPGFSIMNCSLAGRGVIIAKAHVRGGGELGEAWYRGGWKTTKPNTWNDFIACAEYLVKHGYTSPKKLAGTGTSAGGILISRAITARPGLFAAAVCNVGCANALRMEFSSNGPPNIPEFGTVRDQAECAALAEMDGVAHVQKDTAYPAVMGVCGWNDPRVAPWEPGKFIAALQQSTTGGKPILLKVNFDDGHFTEEKQVTFKNFAGQDAFLLWQTGHPDFQPQD